MNEHVTIGEVYRRLVDLDERFGQKLDDIEKQVRLTNGRTTTLETEVKVLNREVRDIRHTGPTSPTPSSLPIMTPEGESLSIKVSPKMWAAIASAFAALTIFAPLVAEWLKKLAQ